MNVICLLISVFNNEIDISQASNIGDRRLLGHDLPMFFKEEAVAKESHNRMVAHYRIQGYWYLYHTATRDKGGSSPLLLPLFSSSLKLSLSSTKLTLSKSKTPAMDLHTSSRSSTNCTILGHTQGSMKNRISNTFNWLFIYLTILIYSPSPICTENDNFFVTFGIRYEKNTTESILFSMI